MPMNKIMQLPNYGLIGLFGLLPWNLFLLLQVVVLNKTETA